MPTSTTNGVDLLGGSNLVHPLQSAVDTVISFGTDFFAFIVIAAVIAAFSFYFGRDRLMALIAALYAAIPLYQKFPYASLLPPNNAYVQIGLYLAFVLLGTVAFSGLSAFLARSTSSFLGTAVLSITTAGLLLAVGIHILPLQQVYTISAPTIALFASDQMFFWWLAAPLAGLFFFGK